MRQVFDGGLTARVFRIHAAGRDWTLKKARAQAGVHNVDGQTSFLNEIQRRADLTRLKAGPGGAQRFAGIVDTQYASLRRGILLSPWIEGTMVRGLGRALARPVVRATRRALPRRLVRVGSVPRQHPRRRPASHVVRLRLHVPLRPADAVQQRRRRHERTAVPPGRAFRDAQLLRAAAGDWSRSRECRAALAAFREEKAAALQACERLQAELAARGASPAAIERFAILNARWREALRGDAAALYLAENWRSHVLDLEDDLHGRSCTPMTLRRADWLLAALQEHFEALGGARCLLLGRPRPHPGRAVGRVPRQARSGRGPSDPPSGAWQC